MVSNVEPSIIGLPSGAERQKITIKAVPLLRKRPIIIIKFFDMSRKTKIICTLGPTSSEKKVILQMACAGMNIARLNFSHGSHKEHKERIDTIREINRKHRYKLKVLQDLEGYRIRVGALEKPFMLTNGQRVFMSKESECLSKEIPFDYQGDVKNIKKGLCVFIDDGQISLEVVGHRGNKLELKVQFGGLLKRRKGINIPGLKMQSNVLTYKDRDDMEFGVQNRVDYIAQSFVRNKKDIERVIEIARPKLPKCKIIAKIENEAGIRNIDAIIDSCDGIMIARGDLGVSVPIYKIALIQKDIIRRCNKKKKMVITATQMLESMVEHNRPTRAEVTDVANAVLDGTDCVMLSEETAAGRFPVRCVKMMDQIVSFTETAKV